MERFTPEEKFKRSLRAEELRELRANPKLRRAARHLRERYSQVPFYAERAKRISGYWLLLATSEVNALPPYSKDTN